MLYCETQLTFGLVLCYNVSRVEMRRLTRKNRIFMLLQLSEKFWKDSSTVNRQVNIRIL